MPPAAPQMRHSRPEINGGFLPLESGSPQPVNVGFAGQSGSERSSSVSFESGSGTHKSPANAGLFRCLVVHSRTNPAKEGRKRAYFGPIPDPGRTVWCRWDDRAMAAPTECESALGAGCGLKAVAA